MNLRVTRQHITDGAASSTDECPIALALGDFYNTNDVIVDGTMMAVGPVAFKHTKETKAFIRAFDRGKTVKAFSFPLELA